MNKLPDDARDNKPGIIKIIGIGQSLRGDDAAGLMAVQAWQERYLANTDRLHIQVELAELPGIGLLDLMQGSNVAILVDAVHSGAKAGTIHLLSTDQLEAFSVGAGSAHGWGVAETLMLGQELMQSSMPEKVLIIGIEAGDLSLGESISPQVEQALSEVARMIEQFTIEL